ncbi:MAG: 2-amino-4-hydroxy-6-hydroxymethyldihydropteridine diphosphokinase [Planctomycetota bacterium]
MTPPAGMVDAFVAIGSNIEPRRNVPAALRILKRQVQVVAVSTLYRTAPIGDSSQPAFVNGVWKLRTNRPARTLKYGLLRPIEDRLGRDRSGDSCAPRTIDLDVVLHGQSVCQQADLVIPSPDLDRPFVALPLLELAPELTLPDGRPLRRLCEGMDRSALSPEREMTQKLREILSE